MLKLTIFIVLLQESKISNFYNAFIKKYLHLSSGEYVINQELNAVFRLENNIDLTTNAAEGYNSELIIL
jgi:hypothetical protein